MRLLAIAERARRRLIFLPALVTVCAFGQKILIAPYLQPGNASGLNKEQKVLIWQTDSVPGNFLVQYKLIQSNETTKSTKAQLASTQLVFNKKSFYLHRAVLSGLKFDETYSYTVSLGEKVISESKFSTRTKKPLTQFAVFGDCGAGTPEQASIAYQVALKKPQFVLIPGDIAYSSGRELEFRLRFFPVYQSTELSISKGAPLIKSVPFYMILGNHDVMSYNLSKYADGLAYYYFSDVPLNAPVPTSIIELKGTEEQIKAYKKNTSPRFPRTANYSFDQGNVHITCLDANDYANPFEPAILEWLRADITSSKAEWKIVAYHQPAFNTATDHYDDQRMRLLSPLLEELGVNLVLTGHEHNYQRSVPLKFNPKKSEDGMKYIVTKEGRVDGTFTLDNAFDGKTNTKPNGIIYIVSGAGGAVLYDTAFSNQPEKWKHNLPDNWASFTTRFISHTHSFTWIETNGKKLLLQQIDKKGNVLDEITITK